MSQPKEKKERFSPIRNEDKILEYWKEHDIFAKTLSKPNAKGRFVFYEGPPTANGKPGIHHVLARAFKDVIPRYKTMQGYKVPRKAGWDTHGLPVELEVEKRLGMSGKPEVLKYGVKEFNQLCKESVWSFKEEWEKLTSRMGYWVDLDDAYITYDNEYIESLWWVFKQAYDKNLVYKGHRVVPYCPRCATVLSSHEVAQGYKEVHEDSVYVKFPVVGQDNTYLLAWTTTPWTLPGNLALAVGEDIPYVKVKQAGNVYILAEALTDILEGEYDVIETVKGEDLVGMSYEPIFDSLKGEANDQTFKVVKADFVTTQDGTGIVHTAVMYGDEDYQLGEQLGLPKVHTVDENGKFNALVKQWEGSFVKDVEKEIIADLKTRGILYKIVHYAHEYPFCWRCKSPLLYYAKDSWFIAMSQLKEQLMANNEQVNWVPSYIKHGRFGEWLEGVKDWAISRERFWGTPLPIWECTSCDSCKCVGSFKELPDPDMEDVHRPFIDEVTFPCDSCGGVMKRTPEVMDVWFDSGAMPYAQHHYPFEQTDLIDHGDAFPADYICEAIDQTRGWFYTLLAVSTFLGKGPAYKNVISLGHILDAKGKKMSKSVGNIVEPWDVINQYGVDALRLHMFTVSQPGDAKRFDIKDVAQNYRQTIMTMYNIHSFYALFEQEGLTPDDMSDHVMDKWVIALTHQRIKEVTQLLDEYDIVKSARLLAEHVNDLSTWYLRRCRDRFKSDDTQDKEKAIKTLGWVIDMTAHLFAPYTPFMSEELYLRLHKEEESVHLASWPQVSHDKIDEELLDTMGQLRKVVELAHAARAEAKIKLRQPISTVVVQGTQFDEHFTDVILSEVNAKELVFVTPEESKNWVEKTFGTLSVMINPELDDNLKKEGFVREVIRFTNNLRKVKGLSISDHVPRLIISCAFDLLVLQALKEGSQEIAKATLVDEVQIVEQLDDFDEEVKLDGGCAKIKLDL